MEHQDGQAISATSSMFEKIYYYYHTEIDPQHTLASGYVVA